MDFHFTPVDMDTFVRKETFDRFFGNVLCTFSITVKMDITRLRKSGKKLYPAMIHSISTIINRHEEFRMVYNAEHGLVVYDVMCPCYTIFHKDTETFSKIWAVCPPDYETFEQNYRDDLARYGDSHHFYAKPNPPENMFSVSMVPWITFDGFNLNMPKSHTLIPPFFTMGKFYEENGKILLPLCIEVHHAVCDGFHAARFVNELQELLDA